MDMKITDYENENTFAGFLQSVDEMMIDIEEAARKMNIERLVEVVE